MELNSLKIIEYNPAYKEDFIKINQEWITTYFELEPEDIKLLSNPESILDKGGNIFFALQNEKVLGTVALIKEEENVYEIAKMGVTPESRGLGIGKILLKHVIEYAKTKQYPYLYLVSNTKLVPAITLYEKLGFKPVPNKNNPYNRGDYKAEMYL